jgi:hypothetical protein
MTMRSNPIQLFAVAVVLLAVVPGVDAQTSVNEFARSMGLQLGFGEEDLAKLDAGKVVTRQFKKEEKKELAVALASLLPASVPRVTTEFKARKPLDADRTILAKGVLEGPVTAESFAALELPTKELEKLAGKKAGAEFNFSKEELAQLAESVEGKSSKPERQSAAMEAYREILAGRVQAYQSQGLSGIAPYRHGKSESHPQSDLRGALPTKIEVIATQAPEFNRWLSEYPRAGKAGFSQFIWLLQVLNGRPAVILAHRAEDAADDVTFLMQRDFYVGHTFDALQIISGVVPAGEGASILFYTNLTFTEQVAGFASGAAHGIGRKIMTKEIVQLFEAVKSTL